MTAFFDAGLLGFGAFDRTPGCESLVAKHPKRFDFRALTTTLAVFKNFEITRAGFAVFVFGFDLGRHGTPEHQKFANVLNGRGVKFIGQRLEHGFAGGAVVSKDANFDQSMRLERQIDLFFDRLGEAIAADHHDGVEMVSV
ncbi:MAG: hypothetical protein RIS34_836 [Pseudomonadota bacterium]